MRNLKRALSLALAAIMLIGMMVVSASAAGYNDLTDKDEIVNKDAVSMLTTLGIIEGKPDGSFAPTEGVDRAQMAKMISVIMNQGADNSALYENSPSGLTDISSHWAKGHINYCYTTGIIAGRGNGKFDPDAGVTGSEAAKMLLVAAGYDPKIEGLTGADWEINTNALASKLGIFRNLTASVSEPLTRDNAALLIYNALDIEMIEKYENGYAIGFKDYRTILSTMYGVYKLEGVVVGNEWAQLMNTDVDDALATGKTRLEDVMLFDSNTLSTNTGMSGTAQPDVTMNVTTPVEYMGKTVTMYIRKTTVLADSEVLGVVLKDDANVVKVVNNNNETNKDILKGSGLSFDNNTQFYVNYGYQKTQSAALNELGVTGLKDLKAYQNVNGVEMEIIDNDNDGIVDYVLYTKEDLTVVSGTSSSKETTTLIGFNKNKAIDNDDIVTELDLEIDDVVLAITYGGRYYVTAPQVVTGEMEAYSSSKLENQYIEVGGTEYKPSYIGKLTETETSANGVGEIIDFDIELCEKLTGVQFKTSYEFFLDSNGYVRAFRPAEESAPNYALVLNSGYDPGVYSSDASGKLTVLLADGTEGTYSINFSASASNLGEQLYGDNATKNQGITELKGFMGTDYTDQSDTRPWLAVDSSYVFAHKSATAVDYKAGQAAGSVICYTKNDDDVLTIKYVIGAINGYAVNEDKVTNADLSGTHTPTLSTLTEELSKAYGTGDARVYYGVNDTVAVDKNTVAFYYEDKDNYGVAIGYDKMANVSEGQNFLASTVVSTSYNSAKKEYEYKSTNLADVILFDEANIINARDYAYVLSANRTANDDKVTLNVLFENGDAGTLTVKKDHFDSIFKNSTDFNRAYAYTIDGKEIATLTKTTNSMVSGVGYRLKAGTVALNTGAGREQYYAYDKDKVNIWDVTDARKGEDGVKVADFNTKNWNMVLILDSNSKVRTAFVWEYDGTTPGVGDGFDFDWNLDNHGEFVTLYGYHTARDIYEAFDEGKNVLIRDDYDLADFNSNRLTIPEGRILFVDGDLTDSSVGNKLPVVGNGTLWVSGNYTNEQAKMTVDTQIGGNLVLSTNTEIDSTVAVEGNIVEKSGAKTLTVSAGNKVYAEGDVVLDTLTVYGHIEAENFDCNNINDYSDNSLVARGNIDVATGLTIGKSGSAGSVTVGGKLTGNTVTVVNGTLAMAAGNTGVDVAKVDVEADGKVVANDVTATDVLVAAGGKLTADKVDGTLNAAAGADVEIKDADSEVKVDDKLTGDFAGDVTLTKAASVEKGESVVINGKLTAGSYTLTVKGTLTLNGADTDLSKLSGKAGAKVIFGANATVLAANENFVYSDKSTQVQLKDIAGLTFTYDETASKFVANEKAPVGPTEPEKATLSVSGTYEIDQDTKTIKVTTDDTNIELEVEQGAKNVTFTVKPAAGVNYTKGADTLSTSKSGDTFTIGNVKNGGYVKFTAKGADLETQTYTVTLKIKDE